MDRQLTLLLNGSQSLFLDGLAWTATRTITWIPLAIVLLYVVVRDNNLRGVWHILLGIALSILLADQMASSVFKPWVARWRPSHNPEIMYLVDVVNGYRGGNYGFFSSHASNTWAITTFVSLLARRRILTFGLASWALLNCWTRVYLGVHFVGDLAVGTVWGLFVGWAFYQLCIVGVVIEHHPLKIKHAISPAANRLRPTSCKILIIALLLTYLYIAFSALCFS